MWFQLLLIDRRCCVTMNCGKMSSGRMIFIIKFYNRLTTKAKGPEIKISSYQYRDSLYSDKTVAPPSYLHNVKAITGKNNLETSFFFFIHTNFLIDWHQVIALHYSDVLMSPMASPIIGGKSVHLMASQWYMAYPSATHLELKSREIPFAHKSMVGCVSTILYRARQWCRRNSLKTSHEQVAGLFGSMFCPASNFSRIKASHYLR